MFDGYPGGRAAAAVQQAVYTARIAQVTYDATLKNVVYQVKQAYYTLLGDQNTVLVRQASVKQAEQNLAYYQGLLRARRATQLDVLQSAGGAHPGPARPGARRRTRSPSIARTFPRRSGGRWTSSTPRRTPRCRTFPRCSCTDALKTAFQNRSELLTLGLNIAAADVNLALQKSQAYPVISANGSVGVGQDWTANVSTGTFTAGVSIALPIVDGGLHSAQEQAGGGPARRLQGAAGPADPEHHDRRGERAVRRHGRAGPARSRRAQSVKAVAGTVRPGKGAVRGRAW